MQIRLVMWAEHGTYIVWVEPGMQIEWVEPGMQMIPALGQGMPCRVSQSMGGVGWGGDKGGALYADEGRGTQWAGPTMQPRGGAYRRLSGAVQRCRGAEPSVLSRLGSAPKARSRRAQSGRGAAALSCRGARPPTTASTSAPRSSRCRAQSP